MMIFKVYSNDQHQLFRCFAKQDMEGKTKLFYYYAALSHVIDELAYLKKGNFMKLCFLSNIFINVCSVSIFETH